MRNIISVLLAAVVIGCSSEDTVEGPNENVVPDSSVPPPVDWSDYDHQADVAPGPHQCEKYEKVTVTDGDGGATATVRVPLPCDPFWWMKDRGDPPFREKN